MAQYEIHNRVSGLFIGVYDGDSEDAALDTMSRDAGYESFAHCSTARETDETSDRNEMDVRKVVTFDTSYLGERFIASAASRETSPEIMEGIAFFARNNAEAEALWNGDGFGVVCRPSDLWEWVTGNGLREADEFVWGAAGSNWWADLTTEA